MSAEDARRVQQFVAGVDVGATVLMKAAKAADTKSKGTARNMEKDVV